MTGAARERAEAQALDALRFLAERPDDFGRFLALSGMGPDDVAARASEPEFLASLIDFLRGDEEIAAAYCAEAGLSPEQFAALRAALPGGEEVFWT